MNESADKNCLSYWFPKIAAVGLPVPKTRIVRAKMDLTPLCDGETPEGWGNFIWSLEAAVKEIGVPCFLRTGHGSGKHEWKDTCYVASTERLGQHVYRLVEWSSLVDIMGLPTEVWAVRELILTAPAFYAFCEMPIVREFRVFTADGKATCLHPYWPTDSIQAATCPDWRGQLAAMSEIDPVDAHKLKTLAAEAAVAVDGGAWSVDFLQAADGKWWLTDMALADRSWHWPNCEHVTRVRKAEAAGKEK